MATAYSHAGVFDFGTQQLSHRFRGDIFIDALALSEDGLLLAWGTLGRLNVVDTSSGLQQFFLGPESIVREVRAIAFSPDNQSIAFATSDDVVRLWSLGTSSELATFAAHRHRITALLFTKRGNAILTTGLDKTIRLWDVKTGKGRTLWTTSDPVYCMACAPDESTLSTAGRGSSIQLWDLHREKEKGHFVGHSGNVNAIVFSPNGKFLASGSDDSTILVWEVQACRRQP